MSNKNNKDMNKNIKEECDICGEYFNKSNKKKITCPFETCKKSYCSLCFRRFIMDCGITPTCMWCRKDLSSDFIQDNTTQKFFSEYNDNCTDILVEREESNLHQLQHRANEIVKYRQLDALMKKLSVEFFNLDAKITINRLNLHLHYTSILELKSSPFSKKYQIGVYSWRQYLEDTEYCFICRNEGSYNKCVDCNKNICFKCIKCLIVCNKGKCIDCSCKLNINISELPISFKNKFLKPKNRRKDVSKLCENFIFHTREQIKLNQQLIDLCIPLYNIEGDRDTNKAEEHEKIMNFAKKCPDNDCRGFLSSAWKCGICDKYYCSDCHKIKNGRNDDEHICDENEKATVALLKTDSKPCPNCGMPINRISGCSQVWTPCCKIAFDWNTGRIDKGRIHSPEYYDFMRRTEGFVPREVGDDLCGGNFYIFNLPSKIRNNLDIHKVYILKEHIQNVIIPKLPADLSRIDNSDLGVAYLVGDIDKNGWKKTLKIRTKKNQKNNNIYNIFIMYNEVLNDLFRNLKDNENIDQFKDQTQKILDYTNEQIEKINKRFKSKDKQFFIEYRDDLY